MGYGNVCVGVGYRVWLMGVGPLRALRNNSKDVLDIRFEFNYIACNEYGLYSLMADNWINENCELYTISTKRRVTIAEETI